MFGFIKKMSVVVMLFFSYYSFFQFLVTSLKDVSMNNQECKIREKVININSIEPAVILLTVILLIIHVQNYGFLMLLKT